jgi:hypothetical protein
MKLGHRVMTCFLFLLLHIGNVGGGRVQAEAEQVELQGLLLGLISLRAGARLAVGGGRLGLVEQALDLGHLLPRLSALLGRLSGAGGRL